MTDLRVLDELEAQLKGALYPDHGPRRVGRRLWLAPAGGVAVAAIVIAAVLVSSGSVKTPVAAALDRAARAAEQRAATPAIGPGQFWYTRISGADRLPLPTPRRPGSKPPAGVPPVAWVMQRSTTETWVGTDGTVRTRNVPIGTPKINTAGTPPRRATIASRRTSSSSTTASCSACRPTRTRYTRASTGRSRPLTPALSATSRAPRPSCAASRRRARA